MLFDAFKNKARSVLSKRKNVELAVQGSFAVNLVLGMFTLNAVRKLRTKYEFSGLRGHSKEYIAACLAGRIEKDKISDMPIDYIDVVTGNPSAKVSV